MAIVRARRISWARAFLCGVWACWPAFLFYLLLLQPAVLSRSRLALAGLLAAALATLAYRTLPLVRQHLSRSDWAGLLISTGIVSILAAWPLSHVPQKTYLLSPQHTLRIEAAEITDGQVVHLNWFHTSLGDVSLDTLAGGRPASAGSGLSLTSNSKTPITWHGWTGSAATLAFSGSRGAVFTVTWDGLTRKIDFAQTGGRAQVEYPFFPAWWQLPAIVVLIWGASLFLAVMPVVNSQIRMPHAYLPAWVGWTLVVGPFLALMVLVWNVPLEDLQLPLVLALSTLLVAPVYIVADRIPKREWLRSLQTKAAEVLHKHSVALTLVCTSVLALSVFGRSIWTNWALFDDHEIMLFLGPGHALSLDQMLRFLPATEIGQFGSSLRFRPTYWFLRLLECVVWGANPYYWHAFRVLLLVITVAIFWHLLSPSLGWLTSGLLCAYVLTFPYWREIVGWLGPGETYALAALPLYIWGTVELVRRSEANHALWRGMAAAAALVGAVVCIGSKESFVLLGIPSLYLAYQGARRRDPLALIAGLGAVLFAAYVGSSVFLAVSRAGVDVYSHSVSVSERFVNLLRGLRTAEGLAPFVSLSVLTVVPAAIIVARRGRLRDGLKSAEWAQFWLLAICAIYLSQLAFYYGNWPAGTRYDYPGLLYVPAAIYVFFGLGVSLVPQTDRAAAAATARGALAATLAILVLVRGYGPTIQFLKANVDSTNRFVSQLEKVSAVLHENEGYALVIESGSVADFEAAFSYEQFLRAYGVTNSLFLRLHGYSADTAISDQDAKLIGLLDQVSRTGNNLYGAGSGLTGISGSGPPGYSALEELRNFGQRCFSLMLSEPSVTECQTIN